MYKFLPPKIFQCQNPLFNTDKNELAEVKILFQKAVEESSELFKSAGKKSSIRLFALYKQATEGDINISIPVGSGDVVAKAKYEAWLLLKGKPKKEAQHEFIMLVNKLARNN